MEIIVLLKSWFNQLNLPWELIFFWLRFQKWLFLKIVLCSLNSLKAKWNINYLMEVKKVYLFFTWKHSFLFSLKSEAWLCQKPDFVRRHGSKSEAVWIFLLTCCMIFKKSLKLIYFNPLNYKKAFICWFYKPNWRSSMQRLCFSHHCALPYTCAWQEFLFVCLFCVCQ